MISIVIIICAIIGLLVLIFAKESGRLFSIIPFIFAILFYIFPFSGADTENKTTETTTTYAPSITEYTTEPVISNDEELVISSDKAKETTGIISGAITYESEHLSYTYTAITTGRYHFDFDYSDINNPFYFSIFDSSGESISESVANDDGISADLVEDEIYTICVDEYNGLLDNFSVKINEPTPASTIEGTSFSDSITYEDQENIKYYQAPVTGIYHFSFDISDVNHPFQFYLSDSRKKILADTTSLDGATVKLEKDEIYTITIEEYSGLLDAYTISIGVPQEPVQITEKQFSGTISYADQIDLFYYTAPRTGTYRFDFDSSNVNNSFLFKMYDSKKREISSCSSEDKGSTLNLTKNETYEIQICESLGLLDNYTITIGVPKKTKRITDFPISGKLTYEDQCNIYKYTAPYSGEYTFEFQISDVNYYYTFTIFTENQKEIAYTFSNNNQETVELNQGETYTIQIKQNSGYPVKYDITLN
ncbi:MAG: hypothetical protein NC300_05865 [Bacteroidales bacterium]|nr:hypothetical protein [Clostridium sp.]MCM1203649.1 hypothetical protein [Bacteroidales bacterium]